MSAAPTLAATIAALVPSTLLEAALYYASIGWHAFPIASGKIPRKGSHGHLDATTNVDQIRAWWTEDPEGSIGIYARASGLIIVDEDPRNGGDVTLAKLEAKYGPLPRNNVARTGGGGRHFVMLDPSPGPDGWTRPQADGGRCRGKLDRIGLGGGIDIKCNSYVKVAPSGSYEWLAFDPSNVAPVPEAWLQILRKSDDEIALSGAGVEAWQTSSDVLDDGDDGDIAALRAALVDLGPRALGKSTTMSAIRIVFHDFGLSVEDGAEYLDEWNAQCGRPHDAHELARQIERIAPKVDATEHKRGWRSSSWWRRLLTRRAANANVGPIPTIEALAGAAIDMARTGTSPASMFADLSARAAESIAGEVFEVVAAAMDHAPRSVPTSHGKARRARDVVATISERSTEPWVSLRLGDHNIAEVRPGGIVTLIGASGGGKTSFAACMTTEHARKIGPAVTMTLELPDDEAIARAIGADTGTSWKGVLKGELHPDQMRDALPENLHILDRQTTLDDLDETLTSLRAEHPDGSILVSVDYIQIARGEESDIRARVAATMARLDTIARVHRVVMVALSQGSRASARALKKGEVIGAETTDAGAESADLERWATLTIAIGEAGESDERGDRPVAVSIGKARMDTGDSVVPMAFHGASGRWRVVGTPRSAARVRAAKSAERQTSKLATVIAAIPGVLEKSKVPRSRSELATDLGCRPELVGEAARTLLADPDGQVVEVADKRGGSHPLWTRSQCAATCTPTRHVPDAVPAAPTSTRDPVIDAWVK